MVNNKMIKINKQSTISFLTAYIIGVCFSELVIIGHKHSFGVAGFLLLFNAGIMLSILWGYITND